MIPVSGVDNVAVDKVKVDTTRCIEQHKASKYK